MCALVAQVVIGAGQIAVVWHGIRTMIASGQARAREHDQRHEEAMTALWAIGYNWTRIHGTLDVTPA